MREEEEATGKSFLETQEHQNTHFLKKRPFQNSHAERRPSTLYEVIRYILCNSISLASVLASLCTKVHRKTSCTQDYVVPKRAAAPAVLSPSPLGVQPCDSISAAVHLPQRCAGGGRTTPPKSCSFQ